MPADLDGYNALWIAIFWPFLFPFCVAISFYPFFYEGMYFHHYTYAGKEQGLEWFVYGMLGLAIVQLIPWLLVEDETEVPPGIRFLASFYRHPGQHHFTRAASSETAPTFDAEAFRRATGKPANKWQERLAAEQLREMAAEAEAVTARMKATEAREAESERKRAKAEMERLKKEAEYSEAELDVLRKAEELEKAKARLEERRKR